MRKRIFTVALILCIFGAGYLFLQESEIVKISAQLQKNLKHSKYISYNSFNTDKSNNCISLEGISLKMDNAELTARMLTIDQINGPTARLTLQDGSLTRNGNTLIIAECTLENAQFENLARLDTNTPALNWLGFNQATFSIKNAHMSANVKVLLNQGQIKGEVSNLVLHGNKIGHIAFTSLNAESFLHSLLLLTDKYQTDFNSTEAVDRFFQQLKADLKGLQLIELKMSDIESKIDGTNLNAKANINILNLDENLTGDVEIKDMRFMLPPLGISFKNIIFEGLSGSDCLLGIAEQYKTKYALQAAPSFVNSILVANITVKKISVDEIKLWFLGLQVVLDKINIKHPPFVRGKFGITESADANIAIKGNLGLLISNPAFLDKFGHGITGSYHRKSVFNQQQGIYHEEHYLKFEQALDLKFTLQIDELNFDQLKNDIRGYKTEISQVTLELTDQGIRSVLENTENLPPVWQMLLKENKGSLTCKNSKAISTNDFETYDLEEILGLMQFYCIMPDGSHMPALKLFDVY